MYKWLLCLAFTMTACSRGSEHEAPEIIEVLAIAKEVQIPKVLMSNIEAEINAESKTIAPVYLFMPLEVQFVTLTKGVLKTPNMIFKLPKGGGSIDLKDVIAGDGSFYMRFPNEQFENMSEFRVDLLGLFYISNSPSKKIDGETFGLGCGKMIDLKKSFSNLQEHKFLKLNTTDLRYLFVAAGRYVFIFKQASKVYLTQLTITDSRYYKELCLGADF